MAMLKDLLSSANREDLKRVFNGGSVPKRGKKKFHTQMSAKEKSHLFKRLKSVGKWSISEHATNRIFQKGIDVTYDDICSTIYNSKIIEYHVTKFDEKKDERVLVRSNDVVNKHYNLHVVYSITRKRVVSIWLNRIDDHHKTIDIRAYNRNLNILAN